MWSVKTTTTAHYKTRMLVRHPTDPAKFNGTVLVEWLNVSGGVDADAEFSFGHVELLRSGFAYVGVSAQATGVVGGGFSLAPAGSQPLVKWDPARYGSLQHPGDNYSYDIFTQAAEAVRHPGPVKPLGTLTPARLIADGESQSAFRLVTYVDAIAPTNKVFDGFFVHSRSGGAAELVTAGQTANILGGRPWRSSAAISRSPYSSSRRRRTWRASLGLRRSRRRASPIPIGCTPGRSRGPRTPISTCSTTRPRGCRAPTRAPWGAPTSTAGRSTGSSTRGCTP